MSHYEQPQTPYPTQEVPPELSDHLKEVSAHFDQLVPVDAMSPEDLQKLGNDVGAVMAQGMTDLEGVRDKQLDSNEKQVYRITWAYSELARMNIALGDHASVRKFNKASKNLNLQSETFLPNGHPNFDVDTANHQLEYFSHLQGALNEALIGKRTAEEAHLGGAATTATVEVAATDETRAGFGRPEMRTTTGDDSDRFAHPTYGLDREGKHIKPNMFAYTPLTKTREIVDAVIETRSPRSWETAKAYEEWEKNGQRGPEPKEEHPNNTLRPTTREEKHLANRAAHLKRRLQHASSRGNNIQKVWGGPPDTFKPNHPRQTRLDPELDRAELITADALEEVTNYRFKNGMHGRDSRRQRERAAKVVRTSDIGIEHGDKRLDSGSYSKWDRKDERLAKRRLLAAEAEYAATMEEIEDLRSGKGKRNIARRVVARGKHKIKQI